MANTVQCDIVSAQENIFSGKVEMLTATASNGELGVMAGHAPMLTGLAPGPVNIKTEDGAEEVYFVSGGYLEVQPHHISILADTAQRAHDMDEAAAKQARDEAEREMANRSSEVDYSRAAARLAEAAAQLRTLEKLRRKKR
ncbi:ATP synthase F1 subcomplex epsilon subunit [Halospina denitrificans]|uniref:ATP synthase epsilon chain n=1 Tax=Halospina denitrificans TaxID=332522 RepID=A0A4R7JZS0_9GAMM|nr:F0F1 ATP synthase subunit epsilon [Halospina denitrificans]TDT44050.1 ATP synthase F1 subcomplex epsilon subunit [Halospina denitrificans]